MLINEYPNVFISSVDCKKTLTLQSRKNAFIHAIFIKGFISWLVILYHDIAASEPKSKKELAIMKLQIIFIRNDS